jgi:Replication-relaxation
MRGDQARQRKPRWPTQRDQPLGEVAERLLAALAEHRLLTVEQLRILCGWREEAGCYARRQWISDQLQALEDLGYVGWVTRRAGQGKVWFVTQRGADAATLAGGAADRRIVVLRESQVRARTQAHTLEVNAVGVALSRWARQSGDACAWVNEVSHRVLEGTGPSKGQLNADAYLRYDSHLGGGRWAFFGFFVELDRGHMTPGQLGEKLRRYVHFASFTPRGARTPAWQAFYGRFPTVLYVFTSHQQRRLGEEPEEFSRRTRPGLLERVGSLAAFCDADPLVRETLSGTAADGGPPMQVRLCLLEDLERLGPHCPDLALDPATGDRTPLVGRIAAGASDDPAESDAEPAA